MIILLLILLLLHCLQFGKWKFCFIICEILSSFIFILLKVGFFKIGSSYKCRTVEFCTLYISALLSVGLQGEEVLYLCISLPVLCAWLNAEKMWTEVTRHLLVRITGEVFAALLFPLCFLCRAIGAMIYSSKFIAIWIVLVLTRQAWSPKPLCQICAHYRNCQCGVCV